MPPVRPLPPPRLNYITGEAYKVCFHCHNPLQTAEGETSIYDICGQSGSGVTLGKRTNFTAGGADDEFANPWSRVSNDPDPSSSTPRYDEPRDSVLILRTPGQLPHAQSSNFGARSGYTQPLRSIPEDITESNSVASDEQVSRYTLQNHSEQSYGGS